MINKRQQIDVIKIFKRIRSIYDIIFILIGGSLWIFSTLWDIYKLQRFWLDYCIEFYSSFLVFCMMIYSINPKAIPVIIYNTFKLITTIRGRGFLLIAISSLFLKDKHAFHKFSAVILFIGGLLYLICEILVPTTKEELNQVESIYNNNNKKDLQISMMNSNNINVSIQNNNNNITNKEITNESTINNDNSNINTNISVINNTVNNLINENENDEKNGGNNDIINKESNVEKIDKEEEDNKQEKENENEINTNYPENEIVRKTDNPYEIPEDF